MNAMLASGGYLWTVIRVEDRDAYLPALDRASINADIEPFTNFIAVVSDGQSSRPCRRSARAEGLGRRD